MIQQHHIIKQQILELQVSSRVIRSGREAFELQNQISALYRSQIIPVIEAICNQFSNSDTIHRLDRLELDLGEITPESLETDLPQKVAEALSIQLSQQFSTQLPQSPTPIIQSPPPTPKPTSSAASSKLNSQELALDPTSHAQTRWESVEEQTRFSAPASPPQNLSENSDQQTKTASPISLAQTHLERLHRFLQTGRLPWWSQPLDRNGLEDCLNQLLTDVPDQLKVLIQTSLKQEKILQRMVYQFSEPMRIAVLKVLAPGFQPIFSSYLKDLQSLISQMASLQRSPFPPFTSQSLTPTIWQGLFLHLSLHLSPHKSFDQSSDYPSTPSEMDAVLRANLLHVATQITLKERSPLQPLIQEMRATLEHLTSAGTHFNSKLSSILVTFSMAKHGQAKASEKSLQDTGDRPPNIEIISTKSISTPLTNQQPNPFSPTSTITFGDVEDIDQDLYIQNAGMILLWPFLHRFFETLGLVESGQFLSLEQAHRAVLLLQYLVDESLDVLESSLSLNKLLCGQDLSEPIPSVLVMTEAERVECEELLLAVIQNWSVLGNTSIAGLRQAFLQRAGVLKPHQDGWRLQIEHKTHDILVDQLPWSIRVIKLPWMEQVLYTEW
jgi:hypothetical protein